MTFDLALNNLTAKSNVSGQNCYVRLGGPRSHRAPSLGRYLPRPRSASSLRVRANEPGALGHASGGPRSFDIFRHGSIANKVHGVRRAFRRWHGSPDDSVAKTRAGPRRVMILMSDTGGGHRASAQALKAGFQELYGDEFKIDICDIWTDHTPWPCNRLPKSYSFLVKYPLLWRLSFLTSQPRVLHVPAATAVGAFVGRQISQAFEEYDPDLVVSVHPLMQIVPQRILRQRIRRGVQKPIKFATVVTDLARCHNTWYYHQVDRCFVATEESKSQAIEMGLKEEQLRLYGLPIRPMFSRTYPPRSTLRKELGMLSDIPAVLLASGGEGMGPVEKTIEAITKIVGKECQLVVVCGRNRKLLDRVSARSYPDGMHVDARGFVENMPELMLACDVIITKAGPGTIMEALICGLPIVLNAFVPCQEEGNIPYVVDNKVGIFERNPDKIAMQLKQWFTSDRAELSEMALNARKLAKPDALFNIVRELASMTPAT